jgi:hypothetical protein
MGMHPDYTNLPSIYYGASKGRTYDRKGEYRNAALQMPPLPLVSHPTGKFNSHSEMRATSDVGKEARNAIREKLESIFYGVDVGLNHQRDEANSRDNFVYKTDEEIYSMSIEDIQEYEKNFLQWLEGVNSE